MDKFNRTNFYKTEVIENVPEKDLLTNTTSIFDNRSEYEFYSVTESDLLRPDLISLKLYGSYLYWWILMKANDIEDVWNDLYIGKVLVVPPFSAIEEYYKENKKK